MADDEMRGFDELDEKFNRILREFPNARKALVKDVGALLQEQVKENIDSSCSDQPTGHLKQGVKIVIGSRGGYASVKPDYSTAPHTGLLENGHWARDRKTWVPGKHMYRNAINQLQNKIMQRSQQLMDHMTRGL